MVNSMTTADPTANFFMDQVLNEMHSASVVSDLDPIKIMPFQIKVKRSGITNRDVRANFTDGSLYGLSNIVRQGDCSYGVFGENMKMGCYLSLSSLNMKMNAAVKGDTIAGNAHSITTNSQVSPKTFALVEVQGRQGFKAELERISIKAVTMNTSVSQGKLDLNEARFNDFIAQTNQQLSNQIGANLNGSYAEAMKTVLERRNMP